MIKDFRYNDFDLVRSLTVGVDEVESVINMPFLAMFGGNVEQSQPVFRNAGEILNSWWGNSYGVNENSETERYLRTMVLSTGTPDKLKRIIERDLSFLSDYLDINVEVTIPMVNRVHIGIILSDKKTGKTVESNYIWNSLLNDFDVQDNDVELASGLEYVLEFSL